MQSGKVAGSDAADAAARASGEGAMDQIGARA
jgi:hypothetical protein